MSIKEKKRGKKKSDKKRLRSDSVLSDNDQPLNNSKETCVNVDVINREGVAEITGKKKIMVIEDVNTPEKQRIEKREKKKSKVSKKEAFNDTQNVSKTNHYSNSAIQESNGPEAIMVDDSMDSKKTTKFNEKNKQKSDNGAISSSKHKKSPVSREEKKKKKAAWLQKVPTVDETTGKAYTKIQIRRMLKRVKKGLPALLSEEEERKLEKERKRAKEQEQVELQEFMEDSDNEDDEVAKEEEEEDILSDEEKDRNEQLEISTHRRDEENTTSPKQTSHKLRSKPVPSDYVCQACKNTHNPPHWIYDCPHKVTVRGTNQIAKPLRGHIVPDIQHKVFVSGLPFGITHKSVEEFFRERCCNSKNNQLLDNEEEVNQQRNKGKKKDVTCKLVLFGDSNKCRGQAYVTFENEEMTMEALKLDGIPWPSEQHGEDTEGTRRWLSISRMKSKIETKKIARQRKWRERMKQQGAHAKHQILSTDIE